MPLFGGKKDKEKKEKVDKQDEIPDAANKEERVRKIQEENKAQQMARQLAFNAQLAHGSPTAKIGNFSNVKELYQRISEGLNVPLDEILFCTLNSPKVDMEKLLGGQIGLEDLIFAHCKGNCKKITISKDAAALGLTITDNGNGLAFIKRIREGSVAAKYEQMHVGDHIDSVNGKFIVGSRHFEVAKILRELPEGTEFTLKLYEPMKGGFDGIAPRQGKGSSSKNTEIVGSGRATLRLRSKGPAVVEEAPSWEGKAIIRIDDLLEKFLGIRDPELANTLIDLGNNLENPSDYALAVDGQLGDFEFPDDFIFDIWGAINDAKTGRI